LEHSFAEKIRKAYREFSEATVSAGEIDLRTRFINHVIMDGFGYPEKCWISEKNWTDIWLFDREVGSLPKRKKDDLKLKTFPVVVIETKPIHVHKASLLSEENIQQAHRYAIRGITQYVALTNFKNFIVWRVGVEKPIADVDLEAETFETPFQPRINELATVSYEGISKIYDNFSTPMDIDLSDPEEFDIFTHLVKWKLLDEILIPQFQRIASSLLEKFHTFEDRHKELKRREHEYADAIKFLQCFNKWQEMVYRPDDKTLTNERLERFALETAYTLFSRILLNRVAEEKGVLKQKLSNGGLRALIGQITYVNEAFKQILQLAFKDAANFYKRLFVEGIYDWYWEGDGELNKAVQKVLWHLHQYRFAQVKRDIFKHIYQYHMDLQERRKFGEYYTLDEVVEYILDKVGYTAKKDLRQLKILDPGCGSGTFLLNAMNRLKSSAARIGLDAKDLVQMVTGAPNSPRDFGFIFGFDIVPFAIYLTETNMLFQLIEEIRLAREKDPTFVLDRFQIYRTNTLEPPDETRVKDPEDEEIYESKHFRYDFIVGNPPWVRTHRLREEDRRRINDYLKTLFPAILGSTELTTGQLDLYIAFTAHAISRLKEGGHFGFIIPGKFLTSQNGEWLRKLILDTCAIEEIVDLTRVRLFEQDVYPIVLILRREEDPKKRRENPIRVKVILKDNRSLLKTAKDAECPLNPEYAFGDFITYSIPQEFFLLNVDSSFEILTSVPLKPIYSKIADPESTVKLGKILSIDRGVERGGDEKWIKRLNKLDIPEYGKNFVTTEEELNYVKASERRGLRKSVDGDTIGQFVPEWEGMWICYDPEWLNSPKTPQLFEKDRKILIPRRTRFLRTSLDTEGFYALDDIYVGDIKPDAEYKPDILYLVGLLNSSVLDFYYRLKYITMLQGGWFDLYDFMLSELPIKKVEPNEEKIVAEIVNAAMEKKQEIIKIERSLKTLAGLI